MDLAERAAKQLRSKGWGAKVTDFTVQALVVLA